MHFKLQYLNNLLFCVVVLLGVYIMCAPLLPEVLFRLAPKAHFSLPALPSGQMNNDVADTQYAGIAEDKIPRLSIPKIGVDGIIYEGSNSNALYKGIWRRPQGSTPDGGGNTVIVAHRFLYTSGPNTFYHLDKLEPGDTVTVNWLGKIYQYIVYETQVVEADALEIESPTEQPILTLWTCTPLFTASKRLVVRAHLVQ